MKFKEAVDSDPYGALKNWDEGSMSPCSWFGVECSDDGRVMSHDLVSCPLLDSKRQVYRKKIFVHDISELSKSTCDVRNHSLVDRRCQSIT